MPTIARVSCILTLIALIGVAAVASLSTLSNPSHWVYAVSSAFGACVLMCLFAILDILERPKN